jgi:hypothetical protein
LNLLRHLTAEAVPAKWGVGNLLDELCDLLKVAHGRASLSKAMASA